MDPVMELIPCSGFIPDSGGDMQPNPFYSNKSLLIEGKAPRLQTFCLYPGDELYEKHLYNASASLTRDQKLNYLKDNLLEYIQRLQNLSPTDVSDEQILTKATDICHILNIENFTPSRSWLNTFKKNFLLTNGRMAARKISPSLEVQTNNFEDPSSQKTLLYRLCAQKNFVKTAELPADLEAQRRSRKLEFFKQVLLEYIKRAQTFPKEVLTEENVKQIALQLKDMLKMEDFQPSTQWLSEFKAVALSENISDFNATVKKVVPLTLDLKDIVSFCSRQNNSAASHSPSSASNHSDDIMPPFKKIRLTVPTNANPMRKSVISPPEGLFQKTLMKDGDNDDDDDDVLIIENEAKNSSPTQKFIEENESPDCGTLKNILEKTTPPKNQFIECAKVSRSGKIPCKVSSKRHATVTVENIPREISSNLDALELLKPLEEYALLTENFRAIGLLTQLEAAFKKPETHL